jgi:predicted RND superfamily exporter protein
MALLLALPFIFIAFIVAIVLVCKGISENNHAKTLGGCAIGIGAAYTAHHLSKKDKERKLLT